MAHRWVWLFGLIVSGCSAASPLPGMQPGESGRVVRIIDGDALVLHTGLTVRLLAIEAPARSSGNRSADVYAEESARTLEDLALGREVQLFYPGLTRDRYDRALAHAVTMDLAGPRYWLNLALVERGAARVRLYPDTAARGRDLLAAEETARVSRIGLWRTRAYAIRRASSLPPSQNGFHIVEGVLADMETQAIGDPVACTRHLSQSSLSLHIQVSAEAACQVEAGTRVRVRGWVSRGTMDVTHALHMQSLQVD